MGIDFHWEILALIWFYGALMLLNIGLGIRLLVNHGLSPYLLIALVTITLCANICGFFARSWVRIMAKEEA